MVVGKIRIGAGLWLLSVLWTLLLSFFPATLPIHGMGGGILLLLWLSNALLWWQLWHQSQLTLTTRETHHDWQSLAQQDALTGIANRRGFMSAAEHLAEKTDCCLLILDIDHFKSINDQYGHHQGDNVLKHFADCLQKTLRRGDVVCRWGGDEFVVLLGYADEHAGMAFTHRFQKIISLPKDDLPTICVTTGMAGLEQGGNVLAAIESADKMMLATKDARMVTKLTNL